MTDCLIQTYNFLQCTLERHNSVFENKFKKFAKQNARRVFESDRLALAYPAIFEIVCQQMLKYNSSI